MSKKLVRLTEDDLHRIIKESVNNILTELDWKTYANAADKRRKQGKNAYDLEQAASKALSKKYNRNLVTHGTDNGRFVYDDKWSTGSNAMGSEPIGYFYKSSPEKDWRRDKVTVNDLERFGNVPYDMEWDDEEMNADHKQRNKIGREIDDFVHGRNKYIKGKGWTKK
jgi:hypothetical protein